MRVILARGSILWRKYSIYYKVLNLSRTFYQLQMRNLQIEAPQINKMVLLLTLVTAVG